LTAPLHPVTLINEGVHNLPIKTNTLGDARAEALVEEYFPLIRGAASKLSRRLPPCLSIEDLIGEGIAVLLETSRRDHVAPVAFRSYASKRIVGGMLDLIRSIRKSRSRSVTKEVPFESSCVDSVGIGIFLAIC
jgi:DNA-directed RNA polymerase specialized sigma subunit